ncbi:MAG: R2-like ligand-binding oxidase [Alicyclobacillus sp.]|nr:R2-like ligand-binding oxidase [Alicyclobacillus sp.]HHY65654.1 R2-like ligand-binding oxidase [Alicyclobacillus sp.]
MVGQGVSSEYDTSLFDEAAKYEMGHPDEPLDNAAYRMWRKAIAFGTWDPAAIDLTRDRQEYLQMDEPMRIYLERFCGAFYNAEENVAKLFCPWIMSVTTTWQQAYLSTHLVEEFKHTEFFDRYFKEVFQITDKRPALENYVHDSLPERAERLLQAMREPAGDTTMTLVEAFTHYQGIIEGVQANTGYQIFVHVFGKKGMLPGLAEGFRNIQRDEGRHVGFGLTVLRYYARKDERYAKRIKEVYEDYLPHFQKRYGQKMVVNGIEYDPPADEHGYERLMNMYTRRLHDIFG